MKTTPHNTRLFFSDLFDIDKNTIKTHGAFNICLVTDLPLFIDPFLLFHSTKPEYIKLHNSIVKYVQFLLELSQDSRFNQGTLKHFYYFPEIKQTWLGLSVEGNSGRGLGKKFATALKSNLNTTFKNFGQEKITKGSHFEKLCLIEDGIGKDMISDLTTNLIKDFLLTYTEKFAKKHLKEKHLNSFAVNKAIFNYEKSTWLSKNYTLPTFNNDFVILTPRDLLSKGKTWINHSDLMEEFRAIPDSIDNDALRDQINRFFTKTLPKGFKQKDYREAVHTTIREYPEILDYYIKYKEDRGNEAIEISKNAITESTTLYNEKFPNFIQLLQVFLSDKNVDTTEIEARDKIQYFQDFIENEDGYKSLYCDGNPIKETDVARLFKLCWHGSKSDVTREANDGRGPVDYKISRGSKDKTNIEFKLASNKQLKKNLQNQIEVYNKANKAATGYKVIIYFTDDELDKVETILNVLKISNDKNIFLIDARRDNKPTGSRA